MAFGCGQMRKLICAALALLLLCAAASAHSGRTDANGGHYDRETGEYHYHHGYPAHQHIDGVCPYDFDDKTGETSGGSSGAGTQESGQTDNGSSSEAEESDDSQTSIAERVFISVFLCFLAWLFFYPVVYLVFLGILKVLRKIKDLF